MRFIRNVIPRRGDVLRQGFVLYALLIFLVLSFGCTAILEEYWTAEERIQTFIVDANDGAYQLLQNHLHPDAYYYFVADYSWWASRLDTITPLYLESCYGGTAIIVDAWSERYTCTLEETVGDGYAIRSIQRSDYTYLFQ